MSMLEDSKSFFLRSVSDLCEGYAVGPAIGISWLEEWIATKRKLYSPTSNDMTGKSPDFTDAKERKRAPITSGVLDYFPDALLAIARVSLSGNEQHHPGQPLHWDKPKSSDHADALVRHLLDRGRPDIDGHSHTAKVAWRALALLQTEIENAHKPK